MSGPAHDEPATQQVLKRLELMVTGRLAGAVHGDYQGFFPGPGSDTGDGRLYEPGDDVRLIDWNLTARTTQLHVRDPIRDHELDVWLVVDLSGSQYFGTTTGEKRELAMFAAAAFGFAATRLANRVAAVLAFDDGVTVFPPRTGSGHLHAVLHTMATTMAAREPSGRTDLATTLASTGAYAVRRGFIAVISDFLLEPGWEPGLHQLAERHTVVAVETVDPRELELPAVGCIVVEDPETGEQLSVDTNDEGLRRRFQLAATSQRQAIAEEINKTGAEHLQLSTDDDWTGRMVHFLRTRRIRQQGYRRSTWQA